MMPVMIGYTAAMIADSSRSTGGGPAGAGVIRNPNDPIYYADVTLQGIVVGSRYWIADANDTSRVLATGVASASPYTIPNVPAYGNPYQMELRVRYADVSVQYVPITTIVYHSPRGATVYIQQRLDQ